MGNDISDALLKALEAGDYNAAPSDLRQGEIFYISDHELSREELDEMWIATFGYCGRVDCGHDPSVCKGLKKP